MLTLSSSVGDEPSELPFATSSSVGVEPSELPLSNSTGGAELSSIPPSTAWSFRVTSRSARAVHAHGGAKDGAPS
eukprot:15377130-Alexandrium_andersonii.AAC.1